MKNVARLIQFIAQFITLGLALAFVISLFAPQWTARLRGQSEMQPASSSQTADSKPPATKPATRAPEPTVGFGPEGSVQKPAVQDAPGSVTTSYAPAVEAAAPAVVSIFVNKIEEQRRPVLIRQSDPSLPLLPAQVITNVPTQNLGSGVIVNADGYVLTNYHVIKSATNISVIMPDGRTAAAKIVGSDEETDLAVLQLQQLAFVPTIPIAERAAAVGDVVLAIGNPFGLDKTVTMGIVSAVGRVNPATGEDFIQTDAAINSGNSGGALVNAHGELVGINSGTYSPSGNIGIGFAIPVASAMKVLDQIIRNGRVIRAWMGVTYRDAPQQPNDPMPVVTRGSLITAIEPDSPAAKAGLKVGDVIVRIDGKWMPNATALRNRESHLTPGTKINVAAMRNNDLLQFDLDMAERPSSVAQQGAQGPAPESK
ncbi:MAG: trypsin-like peptidase domain-containing protein [Rudaea sp.]|uniref:S1C family serine protease n=1 Tax=unclassified Rudaea TaxID=2627037 RepID=UPI0010F82254|nr:MULTISPECIES: trypsin-like peptidase domain-containing protein [unclassified Rudaea]MBN8888272.1 trypsin-like peptidase domain-containing protein [Rudaea sp.]MBR0344034.1 trypsin-like peptidase domain-containing protein [Rudaea sp.]